MTEKIQRDHDVGSGVEKKINWLHEQYSSNGEKSIRYKWLMQSSFYMCKRNMYSDQLRRWE